MRILILTPRLPWPPRDGGRVAMSRLAESLARGGAEVEVLSLNPRKHRVAPNGPLPVRAVDIDTSRLAVPLLRAFGMRIPAIVARFYTPAFEAALREALPRFRPDVVQIESPFLMPYVSTVRAAASGARVVLRALNVEFRIWEALARRERNPLLRLAWRRIAASLRRYEVDALGAVDAIVPISEADANDFRGLGATCPMHVVPCGVVLRPWSDAAPQSRSVGFLGSLDFRPNQDAVRWIANELQPRLAAHVPDARVRIAGSSPPDWLRRLATSRAIDLLGEVDDADAFLRSVSVVIAPLFAGGGMRIKVLEAMALGKPVVATTTGAGGIDVTHDRDVLLADDSSAFADAVVALLRDPARATRLGAAARETVAAHYDTDALAASLLQFYA